MVASATTAHYALPIPGTGDLADFVDFDGMANLIDAQLFIASAMGSQVAYNSLTASVGQAVNGAAYAAITGATLVLPNDSKLYRVAVTGTSVRSTIAGSVRVSIGTAVATQLKRTELQVATTGVPYPYTIGLEKITATGQMLQLYVFGPSTATVTVDATADSPLELAAYRIG